MEDKFTDGPQNYEVSIKYTKWLTFIHQMTNVYSKWPLHMPIFQMAILFTNILNYKALQKIPKLEFLV
jgi:hypothetical protein